MSSIQSGETLTSFSTIPVDLTNCDRELIQFMGAIQPHGALLVLEITTLDIIQASENCFELLGMPWETLIGQNIDRVLGDELGRSLRLAIQSTPSLDSLVNILNVRGLPSQPKSFHLFANVVDQLLILEFEARQTNYQPLSLDILCDLRHSLSSLQNTSSLNSLMQETVEQIRQLSGFERVMAYRFAEEGSGEVIAESKLEVLEPFLGLHYPASDIPAPARRLFAMSPLRHLPDVDYCPVQLLPKLDRSVDLSCSNLRSVSTLYTAYLRNMGTQATLVMPLLKPGKLWGLISCMHHSAPHYLPYEQRIPLELLSPLLSHLMTIRETLDDQSYRKLLDDIHEQLSYEMQKSQSLHDALMSGETNLLTGINASGVAFLLDEKLLTCGTTPSNSEIRKLIEWLELQSDDVFATPILGQMCPTFFSLRNVASGVLAIRLSRRCKDWIIWFRPEVTHEIMWAGDPNKPVELDQSSGFQMLHPRASFAAWKQDVIGQASPWLDCEIEYAARIRYAIFGIIVERAWLLAQMNAELERSNLELDGFAYAASHDMKEPLRGIHNFVEFIKIEEAERLSNTGQNRLNTILQLTVRMTNLLESLLQYSRIGKNKLELSKHSLLEIITSVVQVVKNAHSAHDLDIQIETPFPTLVCDGVWVAAIFQNLITNAIKYNIQATKKVTIGCIVTTNQPLFYVRDNGIGIDTKDHQGIFELFYRLHDRSEFEEGSGAGLAIVKRAIDRHGGQIWLKSTLDLGSTFFFTLSPSPNELSFNHGK
jgi:light-regulated signal transduction histidine kinase (bacteriophytochrome)